MSGGGKEERKGGGMLMEVEPTRNDELSEEIEMRRGERN